MHCRAPHGRCARWSWSRANDDRGSRSANGREGHDRRRYAPRRGAALPGGFVAGVRRAVADWRVAREPTQKIKRPSRCAHVRAGRKPRHPRDYCAPQGEGPKLVVAFAPRPRRSSSMPGQAQAQGWRLDLETTVSAASGVMGAISTASIRHHVGGRILANTVERRRAKALVARIASALPEAEA